MITSTSRLASDRARRREARIRQLEQERDERAAFVMDRIPRLREIRQIQTDIGLDLARIVLRRPTQFQKSVAELQEWSMALSLEWNELLRRHQVNPFDLEVHWDCPDCRNTGWQEAEITDQNTALPPRKCHCLIQEEIDDLYQAAGLAGLLREQTFERFDLTVYPASEQEYMRRVYESCQGYARKLLAGTQSENLLLLGEVGRGKTFLACAIANAAVAAKLSVVYFTFSEFLDLLRLHKFDEDEDYRHGMQRLLDADLIVLDDLGAEKVTEFVAQELFNIINHRINTRKPIIVSTNLTPSKIEEVYGARIASRLVHGSKSLPLRGNDIRLVLRRRQTMS